ncbi:hypothetical protein ACEN8I_23720 [Polaromonas sp. CT11-55]|uniref:hypothetical protein n=1 Tax=Polaromonas sp. CT11-55 TaxID=3243045 RepID=UPI0039A48C72
MATSKKATAKPAAPATPKAPVKPAAKPAPKKATTAKAPAGKGTVKKAIVKKAGAKKPAAKPQASAKPVKAAKLEKTKKPKLVRDSFTIPKAEYVVLDDLKQRAARLTRPAKKSELLRAGIKLLAGLSDAAFLTALEQVPAIKTGRPTLGS